VLLLTALPLLRAGRPQTSGPGAAAALWLLLPLGAALLPSPPPSPRVLASIETLYQVARVEQDPDGTRLLCLNEGLDSFHSAYRPGSPWTERYFDAFALPALCAPASADGHRRVLVLGLGAGTMARQAKLLDHELDLQGVELDPQLVDLGRQWFDMPADVRVAAADARLFLQLSTEPRGAILVDCYSQQIYVPPHLATLEFFELLRSRLLPGGVAALNLGGRTRVDPVVNAVASTFGRVFPDATMARVPGTRNWIVLGWNGAAPPREQLAARLQSAGAREWLAWMVDSDLFAPVPTSGRLLVDHDAPVEALAHASWRTGT
jgi:spermidine synthase